MNMTELVLGLMLFSAVSVGLTSFYVDAAARNGGHVAEVQEITQGFDQTAFIVNKMNDIRVLLEDFNPFNPLSWGNFVVSTINIFEIFLSIPLAIHQIVTVISVRVFFLPSWAAAFIEVFAIATIVLTLIATLNNRNQV